MDSVEARETLRTRSDELARIVTAMHPLVGKLGNATAQGEIFRALFELTKQIEVVKKHLIRLEKANSSTVL